MKQIIKEVLDAEERLGATLQQAREQASGIKRAAEAEAAERVGQAREQARRIIREAVQDAEEEGQRLRAEKLAQADRQRDTLLNSHAAAMQELVDQIQELIIDKG